MAAPATLGLQTRFLCNGCHGPGAGISCLPIALKYLYFCLALICKDAHSFRAETWGNPLLWTIVFNQLSLIFKGFSWKSEICRRIWRHKQHAATLSWKEHRKGFGDQVKKEKTWHLCGRAKKRWKISNTHRPEAGEVLEGFDIQTCLGRWQGPCQGGCVSSAIGTQGKQPPHSLCF